MDLELWTLTMLWHKNSALLKNMSALVYWDEISESLPCKSATLNTHIKPSSAIIRIHAYLNGGRSLVFEPLSVIYDSVSDLANKSIFLFLSRILLNLTLSNLSFLEKRNRDGGFKSSSLQLNSELEKLDHWNKEEVKDPDVKREIKHGSKLISYSSTDPI